MDSESLMLVERGKQCVLIPTYKLGPKKYTENLNGKNAKPSAQ